MENIVISCLLFCTFMFLNTRWCSCNGNSPNNSTLKCIPSERAALLNFKHSLTYFDKDVSSTWEGEECCKWGQVSCDKTTGHFLQLDLIGYSLQMKTLNSLVYLLELKRLEWLDLSYNNFSYSSIPKFMGSFKQLRYLDLSSASLGGLVGPIFPINVFFIDLSNNSLSGLLLSNCSKTEKYHSAQEIYLQNNFITGPLPECLGSIMPWMENLVLANNRIVGSIPNSLCQSRTLNNLDMQNNMLTGVIPNCLGLSQTMLASLYLSNNNLSGPVPNSLCHLTSLSILDIQNNSLSGVIPNCWANVSSLYCVRLSYNKLKGHIPCFNNRDPYPNELINDFYLHLNNNMLSGEIPSCLSGFTNLKVLDIGGNEFSGKMVKWFRAEKLRKLQILRLRRNNFSGTIPRQICFLPHLQLVDLGHNQFTGSIPHCLSNLTAMTSPIRPNNVSEDNFLGDIKEVIQGIERAYTSTLPYLVDIDLSGNKLSGSIPDDMTNISCLMSLNLSYNQLSGTIPKNIGGFKSLVSLDLSRNKLKGSIPTSIGQIYRLSHLNLSYNNLSGQIPTGNQLQTLSNQASIYAENPYLCADFLPKKCKSKADKQDKGTSDKGNWDNKEKLMKMGLDLVVMSGFATGFLGCCWVFSVKWKVEACVFQAS